MKIIALVSAVFISLVAAASTANPSSTPTSCADVFISDLQMVTSEMQNVENTVNSFESGLLDLFILLSIQVKTYDLENGLKGAINQLNSCSNFSDTDSYSVAEATLNMVPLINSTLNAIVAKKNDFEHAILDLLSIGFLVKYDLQELKSETDTLSAGINSRIVESLQSALGIVVTEIDGWFTTAINSFSDSLL